MVSLKRGYSLHLICVTLLAIRYGNTWTSTEYDAYQEEWEKQHAEEEKESLAEIQESGDSVEIQALSGAGDNMPWMRT